VSYRPWLGGPFRWRLNLRPLDPAAWFEFGDDASALLAGKSALLAAQRSTVFGALDEAADGCDEILDHVVANLAEHHPDRSVEVDPADHPLVAAARLVPEDLVVMTHHDGRLVCSAGVVCFPNRWDLASKIGRPMQAVHAPVAQLNEQLAAPIDAFFDRLTPEKSFWRLGWGIIETDELYQPTDGTAPPRGAIPGAVEAGDQIWIRVERETLRRFPKTGAVLFTIRTHLTRVADLLDRPDDLARLAEAVEGLPPDVADYKGTAPLTAPLLAWLRVRQADRVRADA